MTPRQAIKEKCLECCAGSRTEVKECNIERCPLWQFRQQENNKPKRELTEEQKQRLKNIGYKKKNA